MTIPVRILAEAEYGGARHYLEDRGGVYVVGPVWGLGKVFRSEQEAWVRFNEATGGAALEAKEEHAPNSTAIRARLAD